MIVNTYTYRDGISGPSESAYDSRVEDKKKELEKREDNSFSSQMEQSDVDAKKIKTTTSTNNTENTKQTKEEKSESWALFDDIKSLMKTGLTKSELKMLEDAMKAIKEELEKDNPDELKLEDYISELEKMIAAFKKRITGEAIIEKEDNPITHSSSSLTTAKEDASSSKSANIDDNKISQALMDRIKSVAKDIEKLKTAQYEKNKTKPETLSIDFEESKNEQAKQIKSVVSTTNEELELLNRIKNFQQQ